MTAEAACRTESVSTSLLVNTLYRAGGSQNGFVRIISPDACGAGTLPRGCTPRGALLGAALDEALGAGAGRTVLSAAGATSVLSARVAPPFMARVASLASPSPPVSTTSAPRPRANTPPSAKATVQRRRRAG